MKVSCIIPAYNEAPRIAAVLNVLIDHPLIEEIIVVNDCSTDATQEVVEKIIQKNSTVTLINHSQNRGKTSAILEGVIHAKCDMLLFIDADLIGLTKQAVTNLVTPVLEGKSQISISLRTNALLIYKLLGLDFVSGERVLPKRLILENQAKLQTLPGFGLEVFMNELIIAEKLKLSIVYWSTVISPRKSVKIGFYRGSIGDMKMVAQIVTTIGIRRIVYQNYVMGKLAWH